MKKITFLIIIFIAFTFSLSSCFFGSDRNLFTSEDELAEQSASKILEAIKNKDEAMLREMFSLKALEEADDFAGNANHLFEFFQGNVISIEQDVLSSGEQVRDGRVSQMLRFWYVITTDKETYKLFAIDYTKDTIDPNNQGLYALRIIKAENEGTQFTYWQDMMIPGIYIPDE